MQFTVDHSACVKAAGDVVTGILLSAIVQAFLQDSVPKIDRCGLHWIRRTRSEWMAETGLTPMQYRRAISVLKTNVLVDVKVMRHEGVTYSHIRLLQPITRFLPANAGKVSGKVVLTIPNSIYSIKSKESSECVQVHAIGVSTGADNTPGQGESGGEKGSTEIKRGWMMKAADVLKAKRASATGSLSAYWKSRCALISQTYQKPLTQKEQGQLKMLQGYLGEQTRPVIDYVVEHWYKFATRAATAAGCSCPSEPHIGFLLKHHAVAINLLVPSDISSPLVVELAEPVQLIATVVETTDPVQTLTPQELAELLADLKSP